MDGRTTESLPDGVDSWCPSSFRWSSAFGAIRLVLEARVLPAPVHPELVLHDDLPIRLWFGLRMSKVSRSCVRDELVRQSNAVGLDVVGKSFRPEPHPVRQFQAAGRITPIDRDPEPRW